MALYDARASINDDGLSVYGENVARLMKPNGKTPTRILAGRARAELSLLQKRYGELSALYSSSSNMPPVAEWLLDNYFLARGEALKAIDELRVPARLSSEKGVPSLYWLCLCLVRSGEGRVTPERCKAFFDGCQGVYVLSAREISLLTSMLRAALLSELTSLYSDGTLTSEAAESAERLFTSMRLLSTLDFSELLESIDRVEQLYLQDPAGVYAGMSEKTRSHYKARTAFLAKRRRVSELRAAERVLHLSKTAKDEGRHIGYWLYTMPLGDKKPAKNGGIYISLNVLLTLIICLSLAWGFRSATAGLLLLLPISEIVKFLIDLLALGLLPPAHVPRMELENGVPIEGRTICVISSLLSSEKSGGALARKLEEYRLSNANAGGNLLFGILGDLPDANEPSRPEDEAIIASAREAVDALNAKYGGGFYFFLREREYNERDKKFMAYERKRGAITQLVRLLEGERSMIQCISGGALSLNGVKYIITLDEDTRLTPDSALSLIGAMLHPLNKPLIDEGLKKVVSGHGIVSPRMSTELKSVGRSDFSSIFAGQGGSDPYGCDCSEVYMDAFSNGGFAGKGVIDVHAFYTCLDERFPENSVLSHDALEGGYLRGALMTDTELLDSYPYDILSYYKRMHRWTRGDWQNMPWAGSRGRALMAIDRFRLLDSLRRSLFAPMCFIAFMLAFFAPGIAFTTCAVIALLSLCLRLIQAISQNLGSDLGSSQLRLRSHLIRGVNEALMQTLIRLMLLPYEAFICLSAAIAALWRMLISHKNMLSWTPASVFDGKKQSLGKFYGSMWFSLLSGIVLLLLSPSPLGKAAGIVWMLSPAMALALSRPKKEDKLRFTPENRQYLLACSARIWTFFEEFCSPEDNYLPPDNYQERPPVGIAHRTSPTNIGLCLVSALAAIDLGISKPEAALRIIRGILETMERMPKWNGHLYNWYDTQSLKPLHPAYVSTVDSGNLAVCLMVLREGLLELGEPSLAKKCEEQLAPISFKPLYDKKRRLFSIGMDTEKNQLSKSYYDLMASEARIASFITVARGEVPRRHWQSLSRAQFAKGNRRGCVSWTGTMFEYLMPRLFFKSPRGSLIYETDHFCVSTQKLRTKKKKLPWGISESAYYSLDSSLNYRYKAHGCAALALKREQDKELVVSPYSSFLALCCGPESAISNLKELERISPQGKYGFWDAYDFTPGRANDRKGEIVRCAMAHHLGMSLIAIANTLSGDKIPERLMRVPEISAYSCLLEEKLPLSSTVLRRRMTKSPEKPPRAGTIFWEKRGEFTDWYAPVCCALSNGAYNLMLTDSGSSFVQWNSTVPYFTTKETPSDTHGLDLWLECDGSVTPLLPSPESGPEVKSRWEFTLSAAKLTTMHKNFTAQTVVSVSSECNGEKRQVSVNPNDNVKREARLIIGFKPVLASYNDYVNHPAFYGLGLEAYELDGSLIIKRLKRGKNPAFYMCLASSVAMEYSARREILPGRSGMAAQLQERLLSPLGALSDPYICAAAELRISPGNDSALSFALAVGTSEAQAYDSAQRILTESNDAAADFPASYAKNLGLSENQLEAAFELLRAIEFPAPRLSEPSIRELWRFGVSGDKPLITGSVNSEEDLEDAASLMLCHNFLSALHHSFDLVFITDEGGDYMRPLSANLEKLRRGPGSGSPSIRTADHTLGADLLRMFHCEPRERALDGENALYVMSTLQPDVVLSYPEYHWNDDYSFSFYVNRSLPLRAWGNMLTNGHFGFFATDCGTGHMWFENAREYHINRWLNDPLATQGTERLTLGGTSAFAAPGDETKVSFDFGSAQWEKEINGVSVVTHAFIPPEINARVLMVSWDGGPMDISWYTDLVLGGNPSSGRGLRIKQEDGFISAWSVEKPFSSHPFTVCLNSGFDNLVTEREKWLRGEEGLESRAVDCMGLRARAESPFILVCGCDEPERLMSLLSCETAQESLQHTRALWRKAVTRLEVETPLPSLDRLVNAWLPYQALACRLMGRCSIYQSGGATGFRDQLQDAVNLILLNPELARAQIILCAEKQYEEGDVMHWWHSLPDGSRGVRTRCSDDLLWLPWALCEYVEKTGDRAICDAPVSWLTSPELGEGEHDRYEQAVSSEKESPVIEHCLKALERVLLRGAGEHGLLKIGGGDWNDGMNAVGENGRGESVWLSWFYSHTAHRFAEILKERGDEERSKAVAKSARAIGEKANEAWDGAWYLRGWFDDGTSLGSQSQACCKIDSIAQSFAALSPEADKERVNEGLSSAFKLLFDRENKLVKLFDPPFKDSEPYPGYIESYGEGFRENGGQYTHGAVWLAHALLLENRSDEAFELIEAIIPDAHEGSVYKAEPFVLSADVSSNAGSPGLAGWSWYTGAAGWLWRTVAHELFGIELKGGKISVSPKLPSRWKDERVVIKLDGKTIWSQNAD